MNTVLYVSRDNYIKRVNPIILGTFSLYFDY